MTPNAWERRAQPLHGQHDCTALGPNKPESSPSSRQMSVGRLNMQGKAKSAKDKEACHFDAVIAHRCLFCLSPHHQLLQWDVQGYEAPSA